MVYDINYKDISKKFFSLKLLTLWTRKTFQSTENQTSCLFILLDSSLVCDIGSPAFPAPWFPEREQCSRRHQIRLGRSIFWSISASLRRGMQHAVIPKVLGRVTLFLERSLNIRDYFALLVLSFLLMNIQEIPL